MPLSTNSTALPPHTAAVLGGDGRMAHAAAALGEAGCRVHLFGCGRECLPATGERAEGRLAPSFAAAAEGADLLILPLPATRDGRSVWCPRQPNAEVVTFAAIAELLARRPDLRLFGGRLPPDFLHALPPAARTRVVDYYANEALQLRNAYITAEAALMTAMELSDRTLRGSTVAVIGYGRIAQFLCRLLARLGAQVTVCARREEPLLLAAEEGYHPLRLGEEHRPGQGLYPLCFGHSILFNTVPAHLLPREVLRRMERGTILIDLASAPFGVSDEDVREVSALGDLHYVRAPSLPGIYAPREAGRIIADCILAALRASGPSAGGDTAPGGTEAGIEAGAPEGSRQEEGGRP